MCGHEHVGPPAEAGMEAAQLGSGQANLFAVRLTLPAVVIKGQTLWGITLDIVEERGEAACVSSHARRHDRATPGCARRTRSARCSACSCT